MSDRTLSERVLSRLGRAEASEPDPWLQDDLRIARLTVAHAWRGDAVECSPHVLASYEVLGLHPDKVWPKIEARRRALGPLRETPVLKKPAQSVKLWCEKTNGARAVNFRAGESLLRDNTISVPMAAPSIAAAYPNSEHAGRGKERPFFKREEIQEFFESCPPSLVPYPELRTLHGMWVAAGKPFGSEIQFFKAIKDYCRGALYKSESTVRSNIRRAEDSGILEIAHRDRRGNCHHIWIRPRTEKDRGLYRRVTTHRLSIELLTKWREHHRGPQPVRKPSQPTPETPPPAPAVPRPEREQPAAAEHRPTEHGLITGTEISDRTMKSAQLIMELCGLADIGAIPSMVSAIVAESKFRGMEAEETARYIADCALKDQRNGIALTRFYFRDLKWRSTHGQRAGSSPTNQRIVENRRNITHALLKNLGGPAVPDKPEREGSS